MDWHLLTLGTVKDPVAQIELSPWEKVALQFCFLRVTLVLRGEYSSLLISVVLEACAGLCSECLLLNSIQEKEGRKMVPSKPVCNRDISYAVLQQKARLFNRIKGKPQIKGHKDALIVIKTI